MSKLLKIGTLITVIACSLGYARAQGNPELVTYYLEFGLNGGGAFYLGDVNAVPFTKLGPSFGGFGKYKFSGHHELGLEINGGWAGIEQLEQTTTTTNFVDVSVLYTFNFWNYGAKRYEEHASIVTPYLVVGLGVTTYDLAATRCTASLPFGLGVKVKFAHRWNVGVAWTMRKLFADNFDRVDNPYNLNASRLNNQDWLSTFGLYLSCDFLEICAPCRRLERIKAKRKR